MNNFDILSDWDDLVSLFPENFLQIAKTLNTMKNTRQDKDLVDTLRVLFMHLGLGYSLKECSYRAKEANLCSISSVAIFNRLRKFGPFFKEMCNQLLKENQSIIKNEITHKQMKIIDGTKITEPGKTGSTWCFNYSFVIPTMLCDFTKLTKIGGKNTGETLTHFPINSGDLIIADRGYSNRRGITHVKDNGGEVCIRLNHRTLLLYDDKNEVIQLDKWLKDIGLNSAGDIAELNCHIKNFNTNERIEARVCAIKKDDDSIVRSLKSLREKEKSKKCSKKNYTIKDDTIFLDQYILIFTTFPKCEFSAKKILELYRWRWQIELVFKRFKSLLALGHLPKTSSESSQAWLYGKLFIALIIEKIIALNSAFSPWRDTVNGVNKQSLAYFRFCLACDPAIDITKIEFEFFKGTLD